MKKKQIPFFNYSALYSENEEVYSNAILSACKKGAYIMQEELFNFEKKLKNYLNVKHAIGVADGTTALVLSLRASGVGSGDEVLVPSHTFAASVAAINHVGAAPVLIDCAKDHLIDEDDIEHRITKKTKAIMPVQLNGRTAKMDKIVKIAHKNDLVIVEDSCQALGSKYNNKFAGTFGVAGTFSFYPSKTLGCFGDGGAIITDNDKIADLVHLYRDHGRGPDGKVWTYGYNARLDNIQAAILLEKFKQYDNFISKRRKLASIYNHNLKELNQLILPPAPNEDDQHFDIYQNYEIEAEKRDDLINYLDENGVKTIIQWGGFMVHQFEKLNLNTDVPFSEKLSNKFMLLPMNTSLEKEDIYYICEMIKKFYTYRD